MVPEDQPPLPRDEALELIRGLERASRHRLFLLYGLLAILAGFISLSVYLYQDREEERAQVARLQVQQELLEDTLALARRHALRLDVDPSARVELMRALNLAIARAGDLDTIFDESEPVPRRPPQAAPAPVPSRPNPTATAVAPGPPVEMDPPAEQLSGDAGSRPVQRAVEDDTGEWAPDEDPCEEVFATDPTVVECSWEVRRSGT